MIDYNMIRDADVRVNALRNADNYPVAEIVLNDGITHRFPAKSRISKHLEMMTPEALAERLTGGSYFFLGDHMIDFRDGQYRGFVHTNDSIAEMISVIGFSADGVKNPDPRQVSKALKLRAKWSDHSIKVPSLGAGGEFNGELSFRWSPFMGNVTAAFDIMRLICQNGMEGMGNLLTRKIPLVNRWEEHLEIARMYFENTVSGMVSDRLTQMVNQRASVNEVDLIAKHARDRIATGVYGGPERERLSMVARAADPMIHLARHYNSAVFNDTRLASQLPSHLSVYDVYNMATELASHTGESDNSSQFGLHKMANSMLVDREDITVRANRFETPVALAGFSDPDTAFFGGDTFDNDDDDDDDDDCLN